MCRLLYLPADVRPTQKLLRTWIHQLNKSFGGHGVGYAYGSFLRKATDLTAGFVARQLSRRPANASVLFHTRRASVGKTCDELCHPFEVSPGHYLAHNGHWQEGMIAAKVLKGHWSDSAVGSLWIRLYGWEHFTRTCDSGVWLYNTPKGLFIHYASGSLYADSITGAFCSEPFARLGKWYPVAYGTYTPGEKLPEKKVYSLDSWKTKDYSVSSTTT